MNYRFVYIIFFSALSLLVVQCKKEAAPMPAAMQETDQALFAKATAAGFTYYKGDPSIHRSSPQAAHAGFFRVRFNAIALSALTDGGKLPVGRSFPEGALIVKELQRDSTGGNNGGYAIMEKLPADPNQSNGWVWAEVGVTGTGYMIGSKGAICTSCHSTNDRDMVRLFDLFP